MYLIDYMDIPIKIFGYLFIIHMLFNLIQLIRKNYKGKKYYKKEITKIYTTLNHKKLNYYFRQTINLDQTPYDLILLTHKDEYIAEYKYNKNTYNQLKILLELENLRGK